MLILNQKLIPGVFLLGLITASVVGGLKVGAQDARQMLIGPEALWAPGMTTMQTIRQQCAPSGAKFGECFANGMQKFGASPQAVAFTHAIGNMGYMRDFCQTGRVSIAYVYFPFRANENQGAYLVNGTPPLIDIDDQSLLAKGELEKNPAYTRLAEKYSEITIFPGNRSGTSYPVAKELPGGGQRFIADYSLHNICHACKVVGMARFAFDFNRSGKFLGTKLISTTAVGQN